MDNEKDKHPIVDTFMSVFQKMSNPRYSYVIFQKSQYFNKTQIHLCQFIKQKNHSNVMSISHKNNKNTNVRYLPKKY